MSKQVLVTGAAGFIGSHLVTALLARGDRVVALDRRAPVPAPVRPGCRWLAGDIREAADVERAVGAERFDTVVHLAARAGVRPSLLDPAGYCDTNVRGTALLLDAVARAQVGHVVFASSSSVYGVRGRAPFRESDAVDEPASPYAATKRAGEILAGTFHRLYGVPVTCLRFFTVYGPRQRPDMAIHRFTRLIDEGRLVELYGDGSSRRDYTFVNDAVDAVLRAVDRPGGFRVYNVGSARAVSLDRLVELIGARLGQTPRIVRQPQQPGDVPLTFADVSLARSELGYEPRTAIEDGIAQFVTWYREEAACLAPTQ